MAVTPEVLLAAADAIGRGNSEVAWRNAASRAYYAAFHRCRSVAKDARLSFPETGSVHAGLIDVLTHPLNPSRIRSLGYLLDLCRAHRVDADYQIDEKFHGTNVSGSASDRVRLLHDRRAGPGHGRSRRRRPWGTSQESLQRRLWLTVERYWQGQNRSDPTRRPICRIAMIRL